MFRKFINFISEANTTHRNQLMALAKIEYGNDWEYALNELLNGKSPSVGIKQ
jgi:hypothetical protein